MLNVVFSFLVAPFLPVFFYASFWSSVSPFPKEKVSQGKTVSVISEGVLGEEDEKKEASGTLQNCNLFPLEQNDAQYAPVRKKDYGDLKIFSGASVAIDVDSGTILHYDNGRKRSQIASLTKMMTAILVVENIKNLDKEVVDITPEALVVPGTVVGCPTSGFCPSNRMYSGEKVYAIDLLKVMLLNSANDAATALGIHIAGTGEKFVEMMNKKSKELGLKDTNFCTPSGLEKDGHEEECYSSAYDIARVGAYSLKHQLIWDIMNIEEGEFYSTNGNYMHVMKNTDLLLGEFPNCIGGKTGFTPLAGKSLLLGSVDATRKHKVIAVILNDDKRWEDMRKLVDWVYDNYEWR